MKNFALLLVMIAGIFTACQQENDLLNTKDIQLNETTEEYSTDVEIDNRSQTDLVLNLGLDALSPNVLMNLTDIKIEVHVSESLNTSDLTVVLSDEDIITLQAYSSFFTLEINKKCFVVVCAGKTTYVCPGDPDYEKLLEEFGKPADGIITPDILCVPRVEFPIFNEIIISRGNGPDIIHEGISISID